MNIFVNIGIYQAVWFLCVLQENLGAILALPLLFLHLYLSPCKVEDLKLMGILLLVGSVIDGLLHIFGYMNYNVSALPIPLWLAVIWLALATLPHHSLNWLKGRYLLSAFAGLFAGPLAYWAGVKFGAAHFNEPLISSLGLFALIWAGLLPLSMYMANKIRPHNKSTDKLKGAA